MDAKLINRGKHFDHSSQSKRRFLESNTWTGSISYSCDKPIFVLLTTTHPFRQRRKLLFMKDIKHANDRHEQIERQTNSSLNSSSSTFSSQSHVCLCPSSLHEVDQRCLHRQHHQPQDQMFDEHKNILLPEMTFSLTAKESVVVSVPVSDSWDTFPSFSLRFTWSFNRLIKFLRLHWAIITLTSSPQTPVSCGVKTKPKKSLQFADPGYSSSVKWRPQNKAKQ